MREVPDDWPPGWKACTRRTDDEQEALTARIWNSGDSPVLPEVPASAYAPGAVALPEPAATPGLYEEEEVPT